jgi:hypothetical protein
VYKYCPETKRLSLEEIGEKFGDEVLVHLTHITDEERAKLDQAIEAEAKQLPVTMHVEKEGGNSAA